MRILVYVLSVICNIILLVLQGSLFPYLFGHCHTCLGLVYGEKDPYKGIDFSRKEWALGRSWPFDANEVLAFLSFAMFFVFTFLAFKAAKKFDKKWQKIVYFIITVAFLCWQSFFVAISGTYM